MRAPVALTHGEVVEDSRGYLYDAAMRRLDVAVRRHDGELTPVAIEPDGSFVAIEDGRRVVRFRDHGKERTVLFPIGRPAAVET